MATGLIVGKFYPFHKGHRFLIETGAAEVGEENLIVMVVHKPHERPNGHLRLGWVQAAFPKANVMLIDDIGKDDDSKAWADYTIELIGKVPDIVFTSEDYGITWAKEMGCRHVLVDKQRTTVPISGTLMRSDPFKYWEYLDVNVRRYYAKRICVLGAESTGTTTLTEALARHYQTLWVPEVGRFYTYGKVTGSDESAKWYSQEFDYIARAQNEMEDQLAGYANKLLFCDTDSFATSVWHERYMGYESAAVEKLFKSRHYDLYVVTDVDIPFVQDGIRDGEHIREEMHKRFIELLKFHKKPFIVVSGSVEDRIEQVVKKIDSTTTSV